MEPVTLTDGVVTLRPWTMADSAEVHRMVQDPEIPRFTGIPASHTLEGVERWLASRDQGWSGGEDLAWAVESAATGQLLGSVGLEVSRDDLCIAEVGYWMAVEARGRGLCRRAVGLLVDWAFATLALERLEITTHLDNAPSHGVAISQGFRREGVLRAYRAQGDRRVDLVMFARLRTDAPGEASE